MYPKILVTAYFVGIFLNLAGISLASEENTNKKKEAKILDPLFFNIKNIGPDYIHASKVKPWKVIDLDPKYGGKWVVTGDIDNDGEIEIVSAKNVTCGKGPHPKTKNSKLGTKTNFTLY